MRKLDYDYGIPRVEDDDENDNDNNSIEIPLKEAWIVFKEIHIFLDKDMVTKDDNRKKNWRLPET